MMGMPSNISPPPHGAGGPMGKSVASAFHGLASSALAPKGGHRPAPGPAPRSPGAPVSLRSSGVPTAPYGHTMLTPGAAKGLPMMRPPPQMMGGGGMGGY
jgi:hypothetical protein